MIELPFTKSQLVRCISFFDIEDDPSLRLPANRQKAAHETATLIDKRKVFSSPLRVIQVRSKPAYRTATLAQDLTCRLISKNIKKNYRISPQSRNSIVRNLISFLQEGYPINVRRIDIKSFFEDIDREWILKERILKDGLCSHHTALMLNDFFESLNRQKIKGLPRGIGLSSTLAELTLLDFDCQIRQTEEVFFYSRFVDDIVVGLSDDGKAQNILEDKFKKLPPPLKIHSSGEKSAKIVLPKATPTKKESKEFEYLGYRFCVGGSFSSTTNLLGFRDRIVKTYIAPTKVARIKMRLIYSFIDFIRSSHLHADFLLLKDRLKALTGNFYINDRFTGVKIKTGIYYNYFEKNDFDECELLELDATLRGILFSKKHRLSRRLDKIITNDQRNEIKGFSFREGFHLKIFHRLSHTRLQQIKECWKE